MTRGQDPERRRRVLQAASEVIAELGLPETRVIDVAKRAGMSSGHVMYYFSTKSELLLEALRFREDAFYEEVTVELASLPSPRDRLVRLVQRAAPGGTGDPDWCLWIEAWARAARDEALAAQLIELDTRWLEALTQIIRDGRRAGEFKKGVDPLDVADRVTVLIDGLAVHVVLGSPELTREVLLDEVLSEAERLLGFRRPKGGSPERAT